MSHTEELTLPERLWVYAYLRWAHHDRAGHKLRAAAWAPAADLLVRYVR